MNNFELQKFRALLENQKEALSEISESLSEAGKTVELDQTRVGRLSRMDALQGQQMALEGERRRKQKILATEAAIRRIEAGYYGVCTECDEDINPKRLEADPTHTMCIECAAKIS